VSALKTGHRRCKVCYHLERIRIELLLAQGASQRSVARKFGLSEDSVQRHWTRHIDDERRARLVVGPVAMEALAARLAEESESILDHHRVVRAGLYERYSACLAAGDSSGVALLAGRLTEINNAISKLTGELANSPLVQNNTVNNFYAQPEFLSFQDSIVRVLSRFPEAYAAVLAEFERLEAAVPVELPALEHKSAGAS